MLEIVWEPKAVCKMPCTSPNRCWEPVHFDNPNICLGPSVDPNGFHNYFSLPQLHFLLFTLLNFFIGLICGAIVVCALFLFFDKCCLKRSKRANNIGAFRHVHRGSQAHPTLGGLSVPMQMATAV
ncbi:hypothetical protein niasHT_014552 [Heterodera trifolii]|uniref:Uncharacterized protein n=1 Tax=Heterodera trifolii TaxID=157864 RepID=A0ABD2JNS4_9BILA